MDMKVYVVDNFIRNDEKCEHQSGILNVFDDVEEAIKYAKAKANEELINYGGNSYGHMREDNPEGILKYYCCLDSDPNNESEYADYMVITVTEHDLIKKEENNKIYRLTAFIDVDQSFPSEDNHKVMIFKSKSKALEELNFLYDECKEYFNDPDGDFEIDKDEYSFNMHDETSKAHAIVIEEILEWESSYEYRKRCLGSIIKIS